MRSLSAFDDAKVVKKIETAKFYKGESLEMRNEELEIVRDCVSHYADMMSKVESLEFRGFL